MGAESDRVEVPADAPFIARALDMETGLRHILAPAFFGALVGGLWQWKVMPQIGEINLPNPVHGAFLVSLVLSPLLYRILLDDEASRWREYTLGLASLGLLFSVIWLSGWGAMFCGGYGALLVWVWVSTDWGRYNLPPFRYGLWHAFGINLGALAGGIFAYTQFL
ncbi:MAG: hypothetical protein CBC59_007560 [Euryarchaeota archaeon TMED99]|nr:MAG: hypothetical protein CBC59_007560 [Euryarchaeota archaeon TMED99]|tara:strand:+ start:344 stop:838 length:495 start_codon:yes stop_codon:yes gene_type:complete